MTANGRCKFAEETIETETKNVEELSKTVDKKFKEVCTVHCCMHI